MRSRDYLARSLIRKCVPYCAIELILDLTNFPKPPKKDREDNPVVITATRLRDSHPSVSLFLRSSKLGDISVLVTTSTNI